MHKKGFFFILDAIIALFIITLGLASIYSFSMFEPVSEQTTFLSFDYMSYLTSNTIIDVNNEFAGPQGNLSREGEISDLDHTLLEQAAEFYYRNITYSHPLTYAAKFIGNVTQNAVPESYGLILSIDGTIIYEKQGAVSFENATLVIPSKRIVHGLYQDTEFFGPYVAEVVVWR